MTKKRTDALKAYRAQKKRKLKAPAASRPKMFVPRSTLISKLAELMAEVQMLRNQIIPCRTAVDIGTDIVTHHWDVMKRVQVKGQATDGKSKDTYTFPTCRYEFGVKKPYALGELDAFVFVHTEEEKFFIMPADDIIKSGRHTITFGPNSHQQWENAWCVLKTARSTILETRPASILKKL